jgi:hypothetical protein
MIDANDVGTREAARLFPVSERDGVVVLEPFDIESYAPSRTLVLAAADFYEDSNS